ncbi:MAG: CBS domain-containing protein [Candidatus Micrarchaeota archaeon]|nr:CBS domain-containing protein [Candidatus Micrarchaeota archaeon]
MGSGIKVKDVMVKRIITMDANKAIAEAAKKMAQNEIGSVIIINDKKEVKGIVTERDLVRRVIAKGIDAKKEKVGKIMTRGIVTVSPDMEIEKAAKLMIKEGVKKLPVIDKKGILIGIISEDDMSKAWPGLIDIAEERGYLKAEM